MLKHYDIDSLDNYSVEAVDRLYRWMNPLLQVYFRPEVRGLESIPEGAALYVANHSGGIITPDSFVFGCALYAARGVDYMPYGLGHDIIGWPVFNQLIVPLGAVRASQENAHRLFETGRKALVYPGGDVDDMRPFRHRHRVVFGGRTGYIKLALRENVPIIPVVTAGGHSTFIVIDDMRWLASALRLDRIFRTRVWPLALSIPWGLTLGVVPAYIPFPSKILQEVMAPIRFERTGPEAARDEAYVRQCADQVEGAMQATLTRLADERRRLRRPRR